jgi:hypothetical protein
MARKRISQWSRPPSRFHPARQHGFTFESRAAARRRDRSRSRGLAAHAGDNRMVQRLARSLEKPTTHPRNLASMRYVRKQRIVFNGHLHWLVRRQAKRLHLATLMPRGWLIPADELAHQNARQLLAQIRQVMVRAKVGAATGWAYLVLDIEYIEHLDAFAFHVHGIATQGVARVLRSVGKRPKLKWPKDAKGIPKRPCQLKLVGATRRVS